MKGDNIMITTSSEAVNTMTSYVNSFTCDYDEFAEKNGNGTSHTTTKLYQTMLCLAKTPCNY